MHRRAEIMDPRNDEPFDREAWRQLLAADANAPPKDTDRVILAEARRALTPRISRWWLPASLAASLLLAVLLVQWQLQESGAPALVTESDVLSAPAASATNREAVPREAPAEVPAATPIPAPLVEEERGLSPPHVDAAPAVGEQAADEAPPAQAESTRELGKLQASKQSAAARRNPEEWYAEIETLRAAGRIEEAETELARLEAAWPGWLASHRQEKR